MKRDETDQCRPKYGSSKGSRRVRENTIVILNASFVILRAYLREFLDDFLKIPKSAEHDNEAKSRPPGIPGSPHLTNVGCTQSPRELSPAAARIGLW